MINYTIEQNKIFEYLLNQDHSKGKAKAKFFFQCGFSLENIREFIESLKRHPFTATLTEESSHPEGTKLTYECRIATPDGSHPCIRTVWIRATKMEADRRMTIQRLVTAYPHRL